MRLLPVLLALAAALYADGVSQQELERHVRMLASPEFMGRRGDGARKAERYVLEAFQAAGLRTIVRSHRGRGDVPARNVIGVLRAGREPSEEHVILSAHYDHLGRRGGVLFPGACDNASGVASLLELARLLKPPLRRDVLFIAFDQEEIGMHGSRGYAKQPLRPLAQCAAFLTVDMLGRELADVTKGLLFCVGTEHSDTLLGVVEQAPRPEGVRLVYAGADIVGPRSDFVAFERRKIPYLFFSVGENSDYHRPTDTPDRLDFEKLRKQTQTLLSIARRVIAAPRPRFLETPACRPQEAGTLAVAVGQLLEQQKKLGLGAGEVVMGKFFQAFLQGIEKRGAMTPAERKQLVTTCRTLVRMLERKR